MDVQRLPATALQIRNNRWTHLAAVTRAFRRLERLTLTQGSDALPFMGISELPPLVLDTTRVTTPPGRGWPTDCIPSPEMYALRRRRGAVSVPQTIHAAGEARWRAAGRTWALRAPAMHASARLPFIKMVRQITGWSLIQSKTSTDPLYDRTAECYTLHEAIKTQGLWARCGQHTTLTPWT
jgi:hypothetical protein